MAFSALEALQAFGAGRQMAMQDRERQRADTLRQGLVSAYDVNTGQIDPTAARQAFAGAGDIGGAMEFDRSRLQNVEAELENNRDRLILGAQLFSNVNDESSYQAALNIGRQNGIDIAGVPPNFDPSYVQGVVQLGTRLQQAGRNAQPYRWRSNSGDLMEIGPDGQTRTAYDDPTERSRWERIEDPSTGEIRLVQVPMSGGGQSDEDLPSPASPQEARQLPPGTRFRLPDGSIGTVPGGPSQSATGGFP